MELDEVIEANGARTLVMVTEEPNIIFNPLTFPDHTYPNGYLPDSMGAQACWWVFVTGMQRLQDVGQGPSTQIILETEQWLNTHFVQQKKSAAMIYGLPNAGILDQYWTEVTKEAIRCGYAVPAASLMSASPLMLESTNGLIN